MLNPSDVTQPGKYLYWADLNGCDLCPVEIRDVGECGLAMFFKGRDDYELLSEVSGRFERADG